MSSEIEAFEVVMNKIEQQAARISKLEQAIGRQARATNSALDVVPDAASLPTTAAEGKTYWVSSLGQVAVYSGGWIYV